MKFKLDKKLKYMYAYAPKHPLANKVGKIYEHIYVMCEHIGRKLKEHECVHHKDRNRSNNSLDNLELLTISEHTKLHQKEDNGVIHIAKECLNCGNIFETTERCLQVYCSAPCGNRASRKFEITKEELEILVWLKPTTEIAEMFGVSDVAIAKRCKKLNVDKPPRGYWSKVAAGKV